MQKLNRAAHITIEQLIMAYQSHLEGLIGAKIPTHLRSVVSTEDVLQTVWMEIDRSLPAFRFQTEKKLGAWIKAIARSRLRDALRHAQAYGRGGVYIVGQGRTSATGVIGTCCAAGRSPSSAVAGQEASIELLKALQTLSRRDQQIMRLRYFDGLTTKQTAHAMDLPLTTVNGSIYRAKREVAALMGDSGKYFNDP